MVTTLVIIVMLPHTQSDDISIIRDSFIQDGVSWELDNNMKLRHLWKKLQRTEDALRRCPKAVTYLAILI